MSITIHYDKCELELIDSKNIVTDFEGEIENKQICIKISNKPNVVWLKWKGKVNGLACIGCELKNKVEYGTNGKFGSQKLFDCADKKGVLIIINDNINTCVNGRHREISICRHETIEKDSICCIIPMNELSKYASLKIDIKISKTLKNETKYGNCKWIGLVNGVECIGAEMDSPQKNGTAGSFNGFNLFQCQGKHGVIYKAKDVSLLKK